ncbi:MAG: hypothetical protein M0Q29_11710 [Thiopseudomonas sp.]|nr:hypothetical protein [Thiopseudomonas sp.]MCK9466530.1 hypothetical protein [Thiopseudomonas sp.]
MFIQLKTKLGEHCLVDYEALDTARCTGDYSSFIARVADSVKRSFEPYWWALGIEAEIAKYLEEMDYGS